LSWSSWRSAAVTAATNSAATAAPEFSAPAARVSFSAVIIPVTGSAVRQLCSWAGLTPRHRESTKVARGHVTKQGSRLLRWALIEAVQRVRADSVTGAVKEGIIARRGNEAKNIAKVAAARRLLTLVFYGMRDGQIRWLAGPPGDSPPVTRKARAA
jgi:hypothetical protein